MDRIADEESRRAAASADAQRYIAKHPQLGQLLHDFSTAVLAARPASVHRFARDYFAAFRPPEELEHSLPPAGEDEEAEEEALMKGDNIVQQTQEQSQPQQQQQQQQQQERPDSRQGSARRGSGSQQRQ
jgi:hypothetical protein